jgi:hypothetical protein
MLALAKRIDLRPAWGPRHADLYDVGVIGAYIARIMCDPPDPDRFEDAASRLLSMAQATHGWIYEIPDDEGARATIRHTIWSEVLACAVCGGEITYWEAAVQENPVRLADRFVCKHCGALVAVRACERVTEVVQDPVLAVPIRRRRRVPVRVYGRTGSTTWSRRAAGADAALAEQASHARIPASAPRAAIDWGDLYRHGYHTGVSHLHHFYTGRNFLSVAVLWDLIEDFEDELRDALRLLVLSYNAAHATLMTRVVVKKNQRDFVLTGAQSGVLYISGLPVEKNVFDGVRRKVATLKAAFRLARGGAGTVEVVNASSRNLELENGTVDYVFTDPPFGDYIPYGELNQVNELWLGATTDRSQEVVVSAAQGKDIDTYGDLMRDVFREVARVLAIDGCATVVFHSAKAAVWLALTGAFGDAGLSVRAASVLAKSQPSFKQVVSTVSTKGDPLILLDKRVQGHRGDSIEDVVKAVLAEAAVDGVQEERTPERLFSRFVGRCLVGGIPVTIGAKEFYARAGIREGS